METPVIKNRFSHLGLVENSPVSFNKSISILNLVLFSGLLVEKRLADRHLIDKILV